SSTLPRWNLLSFGSILHHLISFHVDDVATMCILRRGTLDMTLSLNLGVSGLVVMVLSRFRCRSTCCIPSLVHRFTNSPLALLHSARTLFLCPRLLAGTDSH